MTDGERVIKNFTSNKNYYLNVMYKIFYYYQLLCKCKNMIRQILIAIEKIPNLI